MKKYYCQYCGKEFLSNRLKSQAYCSRSCEGKKYRESRGLNKLIDGRFCKQCGKQFFPIGSGENNKQHCSLECSAKSARESRRKFWKNQADPITLKKNYYQKSRKKIGPDGNLKRFYRHNPTAPKKCESCREERVLDIAHKPEAKRNGTWRSVQNTKWPERVWILCPTCHTLLDRMNYSPSELNLSV